MCAAAQSLSVAILAAIAIAGCSDSSAPAPLAECTGPVAVSVGSGTKPLISWSPACRASALLVDIPNSGNNYWFLTTQGDTNGLRPPIVYASTPAGTVTQIAPLTLASGTEYRVTLSRADDSGPIATLVIIGNVTFTP